MQKVRFKQYGYVSAGQTQSSSLDPRIIAVMIAIIFVIIGLWMVSEKKKKKENPKKNFPPFPKSPIEREITPLVLLNRTRIL